MKATDAALLLTVMAVAIAGSYGMARLGHPSAVWLWRDMLGVVL